MVPKACQVGTYEFQPSSGPDCRIGWQEDGSWGVTTLKRGVAQPVDVDDAVLAAAGDTLAFERLYNRHVARIHSLARRLIGLDLADEVTQDVFVRVWQKLSTFRGEAAFGTWLHRVAINVILGQRKKLGIRRDRFVAGERVLDRIQSNPREVEISVDFEAAIAQLPAGAQQVFVLHDVEGFKHDEIAGMMGISAGTSKSQLHRARMILRDHLDR